MELHEAIRGRRSPGTEWALFMSSGEFRERGGEVIEPAGRGREHPGEEEPGVIVGNDGDGPPGERREQTGLPLIEGKGMSR